MNLPRLTSTLFKQAGQAAQALVHTPPPTPMSPQTIYAIITIAATLVGAAVYALLWWIEYLQRPGRRPESSARLLAKWMFLIAVLCGVILAPAARVYAAHRWSELAGWEGALVIGGLIASAGPLIVAKILKKVRTSELPNIPGFSSTSNTSEKNQ